MVSYRIFDIVTVYHIMVQQFNTKVLKYFRMNFIFNFSANVVFIKNSITDTYSCDITLLLGDRL